MSRVVWSISKSVVECFPQFYLGVTNSIESHFPKNTFGLIRRGIINYLIMNAAHFFLRNLRWIKIHFGIDNKFKWSDKMLFYRVTTVKYPGIRGWQQCLYCINNCTWTVLIFFRLTRFQKMSCEITLQECSCLINDIYVHMHQRTMQKYTSDIVCLAENDAKAPATYSLTVQIALPTTCWFWHSSIEPCFTPEISVPNI